MPKPQKLTDLELQRLIQLTRKTQWNYKLEKYETAALEKILKTTKKAQTEIAAKLAKIKPSAEFTKDKLIALADEMQKMTVAVQAQITGEITDVATTAGAESYVMHNDILSFGDRVSDFNAVTLSAEQLYSMVAETPIGGHLLNEWVERTFDSNVRDALKSEIMEGMLQGESYPNLIKRFKTVAFEGLDRDIETLVKSYVQSVNVQAAQDVAEANKDLVKYWKWNSVCENRTCLKCLSNDAKNEKYPLGKGPKIPAHPRCRCFPEFITKTFKELGIDVEEMEEAYRPGVIRDNNGKIVSVERFLGTYQNFLKSQPKAVQMQILGPGRYKLWKDGLSLGDMTDGDGNVKLLKELQ